MFGFCRTPQSMAETCDSIKEVAVIVVAVALLLQIAEADRSSMKVAFDRMNAASDDYTSCLYDTLQAYKSSKETSAVLVDAAFGNCAQHRSIYEARVYYLFDDMLHRRDKGRQAIDETTKRVREIMLNEIVRERALFGDH